MLRGSLPGQGSGARHRAPWRATRGRHAAVRSIRLWSGKRWVLASVIAAFVLTGGVVTTSQLHHHANYEPVSSLTVRALGISAAAGPGGQVVTADARVIADQRRTFDYVVIAVRDGAGRNLDFPGTSHWSAGDGQTVYTTRRTFDRAGEYTYWFALHDGGHWFNLGPRKTFTVTGGAGHLGTVTPGPDAPGGPGADAPNAGVPAAGPTRSGAAPAQAGTNTPTRGPGPAGTGRATSGASAAAAAASNGAVPVPDPTASGSAAATVAPTPSATGASMVTPTPSDTGAPTVTPSAPGTGSPAASPTGSTTDPPGTSGGASPSASTGD